MGRLVALRVDLEHDAPELLRGDWVVVVDEETGELSATRRLPFAALAEVVRLVQSGAALPLDPPASGPAAVASLVRRLQTPVGPDQTEPSPGWPGRLLRLVRPR